jgi:DNA-directed RNA polymerase specialized sigma24 family protein
MSSGYDIASISPSDLGVLLREADRAASWLGRRFRLARHDQEDIRQDIITDLLKRIRAFDSRRGSFGAFAGKIAHRQACKIAWNLSRHASAKNVDIDAFDAGLGRGQYAIDQTSDTSKFRSGWI